MVAKLREELAQTLAERNAQPSAGAQVTEVENEANAAVDRLNAELQEQRHQRAKLWQEASDREQQLMSEQAQRAQQAADAIQKAQTNAEAAKEIGAPEGDGGSRPEERC